MLRNNSQTADPIMTGGRDIEEVTEFTYLGAKVSTDGNSESEIKARIRKARGAFVALKNIWKTNKISNRTKIRLFKNNVLSVLLYAAESWKVAKGICQMLEVFQNKCLRKILQIYWPNKISNKERHERTGMQLITLEVKRRTWKWIVHVCRMPLTSIPRSGYLILLRHKCITINSHRKTLPLGKTNMGGERDSRSPTSLSRDASTKRKHHKHLSKSRSRSWSRSERQHSKKPKRRHRSSRESSSESSRMSSSSSCQSDSPAHKKRKKCKDKKTKRHSEKHKKHKKKTQKKHHHHDKKVKDAKPKLSKESTTEDVIGPAMTGNTGPKTCISTRDPEGTEAGGRRTLKPMTKEEWEKKQSEVCRVYDPETGRNRLVRGEGEIIEEIVSRDRHKEINKLATRGDGMFYQLKAGLAKQH
ncbi:hypothetical protein LSAT2_014241 [Lamellibrachia satsuma]|nr:hypothetical protein LSAT2_014241 [Lamellibrachia satsuma]